MSTEPAAIPRSYRNVTADRSPADAQEPDRSWSRPIPARGAAVSALLLVAAVWGVAYVVVKDALLHVPASDFLAWRFAVAALALVVLRPRSLRRLNAANARAGMLIGLPLAAAYVLHTVALETTSAAVSGFLTGLLVVFTPLLAALLLRQRLTLRVGAAVTVATAGLALICLSSLSAGWGELLTVLAAAAFAGHVLMIARHAARHDLGVLLLVQLLVVAAVSLALAAPGGLVVPGSGAVWQAVLLTAVPCTVAAYALQAWAQRRLSAQSTAVILTGEPLFAGFAAVGLGGEVLGARVLTGGALVVAAMLLIEALPSRRTAGATTATTPACSPSIALPTQLPIPAPRRPALGLPVPDRLTPVR